MSLPAPTIQNDLEATDKLDATVLTSKPFTSVEDDPAASEGTVSIELNFKAFADHVPPTAHARRVASHLDPSIQDFADQELELAALRAEIKRLTRDYDALVRTSQRRDEHFQVLRDETMKARAQLRNATVLLSEARLTQPSTRPDPQIVEPSPAPSTVQTARVVEPSAPTAVQTAKVVEPSAPTAVQTAKVVEPSAPTAGPTAKAVEPSAPTAVPTAKAVEPSASPAVPAAKVVEPSAPTAVQTAKVVEPSASPTAQIAKAAKVVEPSASPIVQRPEGVAPTAPAATPTATNGIRQTVPILELSTIRSSDPKESTDRRSEDRYSATIVESPPALVPKVSASPPPSPRQLQPFDHDGKPIVLDRDIITIGRTKKSDVCIASPAVSRDHARLLVTRNSVTIIDMDSGNGCFVNFERVNKCRLREGDVLTIGDRSYLLVHAAALEAAS